MGANNFVGVQNDNPLSGVDRGLYKGQCSLSSFFFLSTPPATNPSVFPLYLRPSLDMGSNKHTIILMQTSPNRATRTFMDYESITQAMDGLCGLYERKLKELNPTNRNLTYDIADLYNFVDGLADLSALVYDHSIQAYLPYDRQWIKQRIFQHLKKLAAPSTR